MENKQAILDRLTSDSDYYGEFGKQFLSNSDVRSLIKNPADFQKPVENSVAFMIGGYFHTLICEPGKVEKYKIIDATSRNTKAYKELSNGEICLLQKEADMIELMRDKLLANDHVRSLIQNPNNEYEKPGIDIMHGEWWKGKADIINHDEKLIIDLKTTKDIQSFRRSAKLWNYDSQAYIYQRIFGYDMIFIAIDKTTHQIGVYDCSTQFIESGHDKVVEAIANYRLCYKDGEYDFKNHFINETL